MKKLPKISIITATYNAERYLETAIRNVAAQDYPNLEYILIDGASSDQTVDIIRRHQHAITYWVSERDRGIYDAWNKGLARATGDWIMFLGCDDLLLPGALRAYAAFIAALPAPVEYISSRMQLTDAALNPIRVKGWAWQWPLFLREMTVAHPGSLHARSFFGQYGPFDTSYRIVGDYELLLRPRASLKAAYMDQITVIMREGGASDSQAAIREHHRACVETGGLSPFSARTNRLLVSTKLATKRLLRRAGIRAYLKK